MIAFECPSCRAKYRVAMELAGRQCHCKRCGGEMVVPIVATPAADSRIVIAFPDDSIPTARAAEAPENVPLGTPAQPARLPMRTRRLLSDAEQIRRAFDGFPLIGLHSIQGTPPDRYQIAYRIRGVARGADGQLVYRDQHLLEIQLTSEYPRQSPLCKMLTPIFHPNIDPMAVCVGDHWTAAERLIDLVIRIGEMIAYQAYNLKSPLDGEAAMWADLNKDHLPLDSRDLRPPNLN